MRLLLALALVAVAAGPAGADEIACPDGAVAPCEIELVGKVTKLTAIAGGKLHLATVKVRRVITGTAPGEVEVSINIPHQKRVRLRRRGTYRLRIAVHAESDGVELYVVGGRRL